MLLAVSISAISFIFLNSAILIAFEIFAILLAVFTFYLAIVLENLQIETNNVQCLV